MKIDLNSMGVVFHTDNFIPAKFGGLTMGPFVFIRPKYENDIGLEKHELTHVRQFWQFVILVPFLYVLFEYLGDVNLWYSLLPLSFHGFLYLFSENYKLKSEIAAYQEQLRWGDIFDKERLYDLFGGFISEKYSLNITKEEAIRLLRE